MNKPLALVDVDGVLAAFTPHALECVGGRIKLEHILTWEIRDYLNEDEKALMKKLWLDSDWWLTIPTIDGAREGIEHLRSCGYEVVAVTAPMHTCKGWESSRRAWLKEHFDIDPIDVIVAAGERKDRVFGELFIDDKLETVISWSRRWPTSDAFLFDAPYNQTGKGVVIMPNRLPNWETIKNLRGR